MDIDAKQVFLEIFQKNRNDRPTANQCQQMDFFTKHSLPVPGSLLNYSSKCKNPHEMSICSGWYMIASGYLTMNFIF